MNEVEAIKTTEDITTVQTLLLKHAGQDFADIFKLGINVALRISDLLSLTYEQLDLERRELIIKEGKTGKTRTIRLNETALEIIERRRRHSPNDNFLFQSHCNRGKKIKKPINRSSVARKFQEIGTIVGIRLGTHSMRKTRGYMMHSAGVSIEQISHVLNHSSPSVTMLYIGLTKEQTLQTYDDFEL